MVCNNCPRKCGIDRNRTVGFCGVGEQPKVAKAFLHTHEEPVISGIKGSGTVFFTGCNLKCVYCQNFEISQKYFGKYITYDRLAEIFRELEEQGASNINLVSPSHYVHAIKKALDIYRPKIPVVYNTNGYDSIEQLEMLRDYVDIFLVDFKYFDESFAEKYSKAKNYPSVAKNAILKMREICKSEIIENGLMKKGVVIRHLVLPGCTDDSIKILEWIHENIPEPFVSIMSQYTPMYKSCENIDINRKISPLEYKIVEQALARLGMDKGYTQELSSATDCYTPVFDNSGV